MANTIFQTIAQQGAAQGIYGDQTTASRNWFREKAQEIRKVNTLSSIRQSQPFLTNRIVVGRMYLFMYDPKTKDQLPYYDIFPLVFPFRKVKDGFYAINMHYLPPLLRAKLMDSLYSTLNNDKLDETTRLRISYRILESAARFRYFKPCVKHYLNNNVETRYLDIDPKQWDLALFLPLERFVKASKFKVHTDTKRKLSLNAS